MGIGLKFETGGVTYDFTGEWRYAEFEDRGRMARANVPPEMIFESPEGVRIGVHPDRVFGTEEFTNLPSFDKGGHAERSRRNDHRRNGHKTHTKHR